MRISVFLDKIFIIFILFLINCNNYKESDKAKSRFEKNNIFLEISKWINLSNIKMSKNAKSDLFIANGIWKENSSFFDKENLYELILSPDSEYAIDIEKKNIVYQYKENLPNTLRIYYFDKSKYRKMRELAKLNNIRKSYLSNSIKLSREISTNTLILKVILTSYSSIFFIENAYWFNNTNFALIGNKIVKKDTLKTILYMKLYSDTIKEYSLLKINNTF